jgi:hypothetical protein
MRKLLLMLVLFLGACGDDDDGTCERNGKTYQDQEVFPAGDGCNTCQCGADGMKGQVDCTENPCPLLDAGVGAG